MQAFASFASKELGISSLCEWYNITNKIIYAFDGGKGFICSGGNGSLYCALKVLTT